MFASLFHVSDGSGGSDFAEPSDAVLELGASVATWFRPNLAGFALVYAISLSGLFQVCRQGSATSLFSVPYRSLVYTSSLSSTPPDLALRPLSVHGSDLRTSGRDDDVRGAYRALRARRKE